MGMQMLFLTIGGVILFAVVFSFGSAIIDWLAKRR